MLLFCRLVSLFDRKRVMRISSVYRIETLIKSALMPNEELISIYETRKSKTIYACVLTDKVFYKIFRFADHKPITAYFSQPTFDIFKSDLELKAEIREFLYKNSWYKCDYKAYFALKAIQVSASDNYRFFLADDYKTIHKQADFYLLKNWAAKVDAIRLSASFNKVLRKLFSGGLVSIYHKAEFDKSIYISAFTLDLLEKVRPIYESEWQSDVKNINWQRFDLPQRYLPKSDKKGAVIEHVWVGYQLQGFQAQPRYWLYPSKKHYQNIVSLADNIRYRLNRFKHYLTQWVRQCTKRKKETKSIEKQVPTPSTPLPKKSLSHSKAKEKTTFHPQRHKVKMTGVVDDKSLAALLALKDELAKK